MATHYSLKSSSPMSEKAPDTTLNVVIWSDNIPAYEGLKPIMTTLHSSMHVMFDAANEEVWDQLWLLHHDIELALDAARPGTFNPLPDGHNVIGSDRNPKEESDVKP